MGLSYPAASRRPRRCWIPDENSSDRISTFAFKHNPSIILNCRVLLRPKCYRCENHEHSLAIEVPSAVSWRIAEMENPDDENAHLQSCELS